MLAPINLLIFWVSLLLNFICPSESLPINNSSTCYFINRQTNENWKLIWQDNLNELDDHLLNWHVDHQDCEVEFKSRTSCNVQENVLVQDGFLVLKVQPNTNPKAQRNFSGAQLITKAQFSYGRFEVRASQPMGKEIWSFIHTVTDDDFPQNGIMYMNMYEETFASVLGLARGVVFHRNTSENIIKEYYHYETNSDLHASFHTYGIEWDEKRVRFFIDDQYGMDIALNESFTVMPKQKISVWLGVHEWPGRTLPMEQLQCPMFLIDYVRVYEKVHSDFGQQQQNIKLCEPQDDVDSSKMNHKQIEHFCAKHFDRGV